MAFPVSNAATNCSVCKLEEEFTQSNGYNCFPLSGGRVACTCPDQRYTLDKPCRICDRKNICGDNPDNFCSEVLEPVSDVQGNNTHYFSCFCTDFMYFIGQACPPTATTTTARPVTQTTTTMTRTSTTVSPVAQDEN